MITHEYKLRQFLVDTWKLDGCNYIKIILLLSKCLVLRDFRLNLVRESRELYQLSHCLKCMHTTYSK